MDRRRRLLSPGVLIGVVHLPPLPGSPRHRGRIGDAVDSAVSDARALVRAGFDAVLVENFGDAPFPKDESPPVTVASLAVVLDRVRQALPPAVPLGVNVLRNDARAAAGVPVLVASGVTPRNVRRFLASSSGVIVGSAVKRGGRAGRRVDPARARALVRAARG